MGHFTCCISLSRRPKTDTKRLNFGLGPELRLISHCSVHRCSLHVIADVISDISEFLCCGRPLSVASMLYFANVFLCFFFYGRLILRPRLTEVRETFTRGGPWVWIEKLLLRFFLVLLKLQGGPKSDEIWHILRPRPQTFCFHARTRPNIVILKKTC